MTSPLPTPEESTRRALRFSLFLQGFALFMLLAALAVRVAVLGWDLVAFGFVAGIVIVLGAIAFTRSRLRADSPR